MKDKTFEWAMSIIFENEGGYSDNPNDPGRKTNLGITQATLNNYRKRKKLPHKNVTELTKEEAKQIYYEDYWLASRANKIKDKKLALAVFDGEVNHGNYVNNKLFKKSEGSVEKYLNLREQAYKEDKNRAVFGKGWQNRINYLRKIVKDYDKNTDDIINNFYTTQSSVPNSILKINLKNKNTLKNIDKTFIANELENTSGKNIFDLAKAQKAKIEYYENRIYESMLKKKENQQAASSQINGQTLKDILNTQKQKLADFRNKIYMESSLAKKFTGKIPADYKNPETDNNKIYTQEEIDALNDSQKSHLSKAIRYQEKTIGIPTKQQAQKMVAKGGMVFVDSYTRSDGTKVKSYYRSR